MDVTEEKVSKLEDSNRNTNRKRTTTKKNSTLLSYWTTLMTYTCVIEVPEGKKIERQTETFLKK